MYDLLFDIFSVIIVYFINYILYKYSPHIAGLSPRLKSCIRTS